MGIEGEEEPRLLISKKGRRHEMSPEFKGIVQDLMLDAVGLRKLWEIFCRLDMHEK